jgi:hypothetical protein
MAGKHGNSKEGLQNNNTVAKRRNLWFDITT